jgi:WD40 repeat protein
MSGAHVARDRRRGSLLSAPKGSRTIASSSIWNELLVGTCVASSTNELSVFTCAGDPASLVPSVVYECPGEIWGLEFLVGDRRDHDDDGTLIAVAGRREASSTVSIWRLPPGKSALPPTALAVLQNSSLCQAEVKSELLLPGKALAVRLLDRDRLLVSTSNRVSIVTVDAGSKGLIEERDIPVGGGGGIVGAWNCEAHSAIAVATRSRVALYDTRSDDREGQVLFITADKQVLGPRSVSVVSDRTDAARNLNVFPELLRISAIATGKNTLVAVGDEDGSVFGLDTRLGGKAGGCGRSVVWSAPDVSAHASLVTSLAVGPRDAAVSGGADGVVRAWSSTGQSAGVYPLHDDTVYGTAWLGEGWGFASLSHDGRLAVNPRPVGLDD